GGNVCGVNAVAHQGLNEHPVLGRVNLHGVMLHPPGLGVVLGKLPLFQGHNVLLSVKDNAAAAGGALVQGDDVLFHTLPPPVSGVAASNKKEHNWRLASRPSCSSSFLGCTHYARFSPTCKGLPL